MSDDPQDNAGGVRRVGRKDRKTRLEPHKSLFTPEDDAPPPERFPPVNPQAAAAPPPRPPAPRDRRSRTANRVTVFFALATLAVVLYVALLTVNPYTPLNPLPPFTPVPIIVTATPLPPTITPVPPTATPEPTATLTPLAVEVAATPARFEFALSSTVTYAAWDGGCDWLGITGTVLDKGGAPLAGYQLRAQAAEGEAREAVTAITGADGAFTLRLGDAPALAPFTLTLYDLNGQALSEGYTVITGDRCDQNVVAVMFNQR